MSNPHPTDRHNFSYQVGINCRCPRSEEMLNYFLNKLLWYGYLKSTHGRASQENTKKLDKWSTFRLK